MKKKNKQIPSSADDKPKALVDDTGANYKDLGSEGIDVSKVVKEIKKAKEELAAANKEVRKSQKEKTATKEEIEKTNEELKKTKDWIRKAKKEVRKVKFKKALRFKQKRLAFPYAILVAVFVIVPLVFMLAAAFRGADGSFNLSNFDRFWAKGQASVDIWLTLLDTLWLAFLTTIICLALSYPLALAITKLRINRRAIIIMLFVAPMWINSLLRIFAIKLLLEPLLSKGFTLVLVGMVYDFFPFMLLPVYTCLAGLDGSLIEAAGDLGASPIKTLLKVKLPLSIPGIISGCVMVFMPATSTFAVSSILGRNMLYGNYIEDYLERGSGHGPGAAYSMVLLVIMALIFFGANAFSKIKGSAKGEGLL